MEKIYCRREKSPPIKGKLANPAPSDHQLSDRRWPHQKPTNQSVKQWLAALSGSFAGKLPERVGDIRAAAEFFAEQPARRRTAVERRRALAVLQALAHRLAGSAKPFSLKTLASHMHAAIECPRSFVESAVYTGPDRRRKWDLDFDGRDRRENE